MRKFAISDIHGCCRTFRELIRKLDLQKNDELYLLGDYIDRGPDSKGVLDFIFALQESGYKVFCLKGNHEELLLESLEHANVYRTWLFNGGREALHSFNVLDIHDIPIKYINFMKDLSYFFEVDEYLLVHAGFNFKEANIFEDKKSMIWIRYWYDYINVEKSNHRLIVHGHTPVRCKVIKDSVAISQPLLPIDIDNGCVYYPTEGFGHLCAFELTTQTLTFQSYIG